MGQHVPPEYGALVAQSQLGKLVGSSSGNLESSFLWEEKDNVCILDVLMDMYMNMTEAILKRYCQIQKVLQTKVLYILVCHQSSSIEDLMAGSKFSDQHAVLEGNLFSLCCHFRAEVFGPLHNGRW